jgi:hypothetical protein
MALWSESYPHQTDFAVTGITALLFEIVFGEAAGIAPLQPSQRARQDKLQAELFPSSLQYFTIAAIDLGSSDAPPTRAPSISS